MKYNFKEQQKVSSSIVLIDVLSDTSNTRGDEVCLPEGAGNPGDDVCGCHLYLRHQWYISKPQRIHVSVCKVTPGLPCNSSPTDQSTTAFIY